jgi:hypothetical protein
MISHVTSLKGLLILQLFSINKIHCRQSQDARIEHQQIHILDLQTTAEYGDDDEHTTAKNVLTHISLSNSNLSAEERKEPPCIQLDQLQKNIAMLGNDLLDEEPCTAPPIK